LPLVAGAQPWAAANDPIASTSSTAVRLIPGLGVESAISSVNPARRTEVAALRPPFGRVRK
jgi:hypothetical protein